MPSMTKYEPYRQLHTPNYGLGQNAVVLGARPGNIGGAIAEKMCKIGWMAYEDDCSNYSSLTNRVVYMPPEQSDLKLYDACVITLGTTHMEPFSKVSQDNLYEVIYGSLTLPLECARRYVQARKENAEFDINRDEPLGKILFIGSYAHDHPFTHCTSYCTAKAGLDMAVQCLAWELMPEGFDVYIIHPHHVQGTPMTDVVRRGMKEGMHKMTDEEAEAYQRKDLRMPDLLKPDEIADLAVWLLNAPEARWLSGNGVKMYGGCR